MVWLPSHGANLMTDAHQESLSAFIEPVDAGAHVTAAAFLGETAAFALGDGAVVMARGGETARFDVHPGSSILVAAADPDGASLLTGGDDGRVVRIAADQWSEELGNTGGAWIDAVAAGPAGAVAWSAAKNVTARDARGWQASVEFPTTVRGLAFAPKGFQLAAAHYDGATLWFPRAVATPKQLVWKGSHIGVTWSHDGRFVVTSMQENALHGWRVADSGHMRMTGYPSKTRSWSWSRDGKWLATSGADAAVIWPFATRDGPMGKPPVELGLRPSRVSHVAFHPRTDVLAIGYDDGGILLVRMEDSGELLARHPAAEGGEVTALAWDAPGGSLAFGTAAGSAGVLTLPKG